MHMARYFRINTDSLTEADLLKRTSLGDPFFVDGMDEYQRDMLNDSTIRDIRRRISDFRTQNVSAYDPDGLESLDT